MLAPSHASFPSLPWLVESDMSCGQTLTVESTQGCYINPSLPRDLQCNFEPCNSLATCHTMTPCSFLESPWCLCSLSLRCGSLEIAAGIVFTWFLIIYWVQFHNKCTDHTSSLCAIEHIISMLFALFLVGFRIKYSKQEAPPLETARSLSYAQRNDDKVVPGTSLPQKPRSWRFPSSSCLTFDMCACESP